MSLTASVDEPGGVDDGSAGDRSGGHEPEMKDSHSKMLVGENRDNANREDAGLGVDTFDGSNTDNSTKPMGRSAHGLCRRCQSVPAVLKIRQDELCRTCFLRYINTKVVKRMEAFRVRTLAEGKARKLLLPLSFGISSASLLHILDGHLEGQLKKSNRAGYTLHVVHIEEEAEKDRGPEPSLIDVYRTRYPNHEFVSVRLENDATAFNKDGLIQDPSAKPSTVIGATSASSKHDLRIISIRNTILHEAAKSGCEGILWADTTTSLAERVLAETAKGRGSILPWLTNDGEMVQGFSFYYPMKDVLRKELVPFAEFTGLIPDIIRFSTEDKDTKHSSTKNISIDVLMRDYFRSVEENYPSIVANVVRTSNKLKSPSGVDAVETCSLCSLPIFEDSIDMPIQDNQSNTSSSLAEFREHSLLCYGCRQTLNAAG